MKQKHFSIAILAYASSTLLIAFLFGGFAAWAYSQLDPSARDAISAAGESWMPAQNGAHDVASDPNAPRNNRRIDALDLPATAHPVASGQAE